MDWIEARSEAIRSKTKDNDEDEDDSDRRAGTLRTPVEDNKAKLNTAQVRCTAAFILTK